MTAAADEDTTPTADSLVAEEDSSRPPLSPSINPIAPWLYLASRDRDADRRTAVVTERVSAATTPRTGTDLGPANTGRLRPRRAGVTEIKAWPHRRRLKIIMAAVGHPENAMER